MNRSAYLERVIRQPMISAGFIEHDEIVVVKQLEVQNERV